MKKHLALVMAALMMASMLAGCGSSETTDTGSGDGQQRRLQHPQHLAATALRKTPLKMRAS